MRINGMGLNVWGNLGRRVARRHEPHVVGMVVSDRGETQWIALEEDGHPLIEDIKDWVEIGSPAHVHALEESSE